MNRKPTRPQLVIISLLLKAGALLPAFAASPSHATGTGDAGLHGEPPLYSDVEMRRLGAMLEEDIEEPAALLHLADLGSIMEDVTDLAELRSIFAKAALDRRAHPEVRAYSRWLAARTEWRRGRIPRANAWVEPLGIVSKLWFIGPFDNEGGSGFDVEWPPEADELAGRPVDPEAAYPGKDGPVSWRPLPDVFPLGRVNLSSLVDPGNEVVVYLRAVIESKEAQPAALRMGMPGATKAWLNGDEVFNSRADHPARFDQHAVPLVLERGANVLLLKLTQRQGGLGFYLRLTDATGAPLTGIEIVSPDAPRSTVARSARAQVPPVVDTVLKALAKEAEDDPADFEAIARLARVLALRHPFDRSDRKSLEVAKEALGAALASRDEASPQTSALPSPPVASDRELANLHYLVAGFEDDHNRRRLAMEKALELDPDHHRARLELGLHHLGRGDGRAALPHLRRVVREVPGHVRAVLALADAEATTGFPEFERRRVSALAKSHPRCATVIMREASMAMEDGRSSIAANRLRVGVGLYPADLALRGALTSTLLDLGRLEEAVETMAEGIRFEPYTVFGRLALADLLSTNGRNKEAEERYEEAAKLNPELADVHLRRALHHLRHGFQPAALEHLEKAFARRPQDPRISELRRLLAEDVDDFAAEFLVDARELAPASWASDEHENEDVVTLAEVTAVEVHPSGLSTRVHQEVQHVKTARGVERMRTRSVTYTPGDQILRVEQARVIRPDGSVLQARGEHERSLSEPWARLYFDQRARVLSFPDLAPGDVVELVWRREDVSFVNMFGDYFGDITPFQSSAPILRRSYVLLAPSDRQLYFNEIDLPGVEHTDDSTADGRRLLRWTATDIERIIPEAGMPGWSELAAFLHVSTYESWQEVAGWWWRLIEDQLRPTQTLVSLARDLVADLPEDDVLGRVAAIHNHVVTQTRYVGLEFGIHGYKPYRVDQVHQRRFGDCKDKAALMHALLGAVGIESQMVILRMRNLGRIPDYPASLAAFNHAILYVPELELWLDGTAEFAGTRELPRQDHDASALIVDHEDLERSWFGHVPGPSPSDNVSETELSLTLSSDGSATGEGSFEVRGTAAPSYRRAYQAAERRRHMYEQEWARAHPGVELLDLRMEGLDDLERPVTTSFSLLLPRFAREGDGRLVFRPLGEGRGYGERFASLSSRRHDLIIAFPFVTRHRIEVAIPDGFAILELPENASMESSHARLQADYRLDEDSIVIDIEIAITSSRIPASDYSDFRALLGRIDRALSREIRLGKVVATDARSLPESGEAVVLSP